jgi:hypothetical protein
MWTRVQVLSHTSLTLELINKPSMAKTCQKPKEHSLVKRHGNVEKLLITQKKYP